MSANYYVILKDQTGTKVAVFDDWQHLAYYKRVNVVGSWNITINAFDTRSSMFKLDCQLEIWRRDKDNNIDWTLDFGGFVRAKKYNVDDKGAHRVTYSGFSYLDLLSRRYIMYRPGHIWSFQSGAGETCIKNFVRQNASTDALQVNGRLRDGAFSQLTVEQDVLRGNYWEGDRSYRKLINVITEIASVSNVDFEIVSIGQNAYFFKVYEGQIGMDRTTAGLVKSTGLNGVGNVPIVFAVNLGNMGQPTYEFDRTAEANIIFVMGQGVDDEREYDIVIDSDAVGDSALNSIEAVRDARRQGVNTSLEYLGEETLTKRTAYERFSFKALQVPSSLYGVHYNFGDKVTAMIGDRIVDKKIVGIDIVLDANTEKINIILDDTIRL